MNLNQSYEQWRRAKRRREARREYEQAEPIRDPEQFATQVLKHLGIKPQWMRAAVSICIHGDNANKIENVARLLTRTSPEYFGERPADIPRAEKLATRKRTLEKQ